MRFFFSLQELENAMATDKSSKQWMSIVPETSKEWLLEGERDFKTPTLLLFQPLMDLQDFSEVQCKEGRRNRLGFDWVGWNFKKGKRKGTTFESRWRCSVASANNPKDHRERVRNRVGTLEGRRERKEEGAAPCLLLTNCQIHNRNLPFVKLYG